MQATGKPTLFVLQLMDFLPWTLSRWRMRRTAVDAGMAAITGSGSAVRPFLRRQPGPTPCPATTGKATATSRNAIGQRIETLSHWASASRSGARRWPMPTKGATGVSMRRWPSGSSPRQDAVRRRRTGVGPDQFRLRPGLDDHRSVPVGLSVGTLPHHQGGGEDAHAARPSGATFRVLSTSRMASCTTFMPSICSCRKPEPSTSWIVATSTLPAFMCCTNPGPSIVTRAKSNSDAHRVYSAPTDRSAASFATRPSPWTASTPVRITPNFCGASASSDPSPARRWSSAPTASRFQGRHHLRAPQKPLRVELFSKHRSSSIFGSSSSTHVGDTRSKTQIWIAGGLRPRRHRQEAPRPGRLALFATDPLGDPLRENAHTSSTCGRRKSDATLRK